MSKNNELLHCFNCDRSENTLPLLRLRYAGQPAWICSRCMPQLIHKLEQVSAKLPAPAGDSVEVRS